MRAALISALVCIVVPAAVAASDTATLQLGDCTLTSATGTERVESSCDLAITSASSEVMSLRSELEAQKALIEALRADFDALNQTVIEGRGGGGGSVVRDGSTAQKAGSSCLALFEAGHAQTTGTYFIDPDGSVDGATAFRATCFADHDGGGWTLVAVGNERDTCNSRTCAPLDDGGFLLSGSASSDHPGTYHSRGTIATLLSIGNGEMLIFNDLAAENNKYAKWRIDAPASFTFGIWNFDYKCFHWGDGVYKNPNKGWYAGGAHPDCKIYTGPMDITGSCGGCTGSGSAVCGVDWGYCGVVLGQGGWGNNYSPKTHFDLIYVR